MGNNQLLLELDPEGRRCYAVRILKYEMSRYHMRKLDFHHLYRDVMTKEFAEDSKEFLLASTDSYYKFDGEDAKELILESFLIGDRIVECTNEVVTRDTETIKLLFFIIYDDTTWEPAELEIPSEHKIEDLRFNCKWSLMSPLKWLENIEVVDSSTDKKIQDFSFITESYRAIAYKEDMYCALFDEYNQLEIGILNSKEHDVPKELYRIEK